MEERPDIHNLISQKYIYRGIFTPQNLIFNANLQEFATRVSYICNLQTIGKISTEDAYKQINELWQQLERSYIELNITDWMNIGDLVLFSKCELIKKALIFQ